MKDFSFTSYKFSNTLQKLQKDYLQSFAQIFLQYYVFQ